MSISFNSQLGLLSIPSVEMKLDYEEIPPLLASYSEKLKPVDRGFWNWQQKHLNELKSIILAQEGQPETLHWTDLSAMTRIDYLPQLIEQQAPIKSLFLEEESSTTFPKAFFYLKNEIICRLNNEETNLESLLLADGTTVKEHKRGNFLVYTASVSGYLIFSESKISIFQAEKKQVNGLSIYFQLYPVEDQSRKKIKEHLNQYFMVMKKEFPHAPYLIQNNSEIDALIDNRVFRRVTVSQGKAAIPGRNAKLELCIHRDIPEGQTVDYHQIKQYLTVEKDDLLARKHQMIEGTVGMDAFGRIIEVEPVSDLLIKLKGPIIEEHIKDEISYKAGESGLFQMKGNLLELKEVLFIDNNVDYHTGNIEFDKTVIVNGDVKSGFSLRCKSDVIVYGCVEDGVTIEAGGNTLILGGILGENTRINAAKDVQGIYLQDATLIAKGNIHIEKNVLRGKIYCNGTLTVEGKGLQLKKHGAVVGGDYSAFQGMDLHSLGSETTLTRLSIGHNEEISKQIEAVRKDLALLERQQLSIMNKIPGDISVLTQSVKRKLSLMTEDEKKHLTEDLLEMKRLSQVRETVATKISELLLQEYANEKLEHLVLRIQNSLFGLVLFQIGRVKRKYHNNNCEKKQLKLFKEQIIMEDI